MAWTRRQFLYRTTVLGAAVLSTEVAAGCSARSGGVPRPDPEAAPVSAGPPSTVPAARRLRMGVLDQPPYTVANGGEITGPVPEVARAVLGQLGVTEVEIVVTRAEDALTTMLTAGQVDLAGNLPIRRNLCGRLAFSVPDHVSGTALTVLAGNPRRVSTYADVVARGARIAVVAGRPEQAAATAAGVPAARIRALPAPARLLDAVRDGQADCAAFDDLASRDLVRYYDGALETAKPFTPAGRLPLVGAYAFLPASADLLVSFDNRLRDLHESGDWAQLVAPFGFTEEHAPPPDLTKEKACASG
jgi:polar amino acid transport system substrate-binding protein